MIEQFELIKADHKNEKTYMMIRIDSEVLDQLKTDNGRVRGEIRIDDNRTIRADQRKKAYATIADMSKHLGYSPEPFKELMKYYFIAQTGIRYFSLSDCSVEIARKYISFLIEFSFEWNVPLQQSGVDRTDDIGRYLFACLKHSKCCICGKKGELHHEDAIGMGNDRKKYDDTENRKISLCREHHTEAHQKGVPAFRNKYRVYGIKYDESQELQYWAEL